LFPRSSPLSYASFSKGTCAGFDPSPSSVCHLHSSDFARRSRLAPLMCAPPPNSELFFFSCFNADSFFLCLRKSLHEAFLRACNTHIVRLRRCRFCWQYSVSILERHIPPALFPFPIQPRQRGFPPHFCRTPLPLHLPRLSCLVP